MCRNVLVNGKITVAADTGYSMVIDYTESSAGAANNHDVPAVKWDVASGSDPLADLETARLNVIKASGIAPNVALFGVNAAKVFIRNPQVSTLLDKQRFEIANIAPIIQSNSVVRFGRAPGLELYEYAEYFEDDAGTIFPMLPDNFVMILSTETPNKIVYGAFTQLEDAKAQRFVTYQTDRIPFVYGDEEGGALYYRLTSCPLPMPADILGMRIIEALTLTFPAMVEGEAVLDALTGEITGGKEEADALKEEARVRDEEAAKVKTAPGWGQQSGAKATKGDGYDELTVPELRELCQERNIDIDSGARKDDLIAALKKDDKKK
jgi:hypothetical protein